MDFPSAIVSLAATSCAHSSLHTPWYDSTTRDTEDSYIRLVNWELSSTTGEDTIQWSSSCEAWYRRIILALVLVALVMVLVVLLDESVCATALATPPVPVVGGDDDELRMNAITLGVSTKASWTSGTGSIIIVDDAMLMMLKRCFESNFFEGKQVYRSCSRAKTFKMTAHFSSIEVKKYCIHT